MKPGKTNTFSEYISTSFLFFSETQLHQGLPQLIYPTPKAYLYAAVMTTRTSEWMYWPELGGWGQDGDLPAALRADQVLQGLAQAAELCRGAAPQHGTLQLLGLRLMLLPLDLLLQTPAAVRQLRQPPLQLCDLLLQTVPSLLSLSADACATHAALSDYGSPSLPPPALSSESAYLFGASGQALRPSAPLHLDQPWNTSRKNTLAISCFDCT